MWRKLSEVLYSCDSTHCKKIGKKVQLSKVWGGYQNLSFISSLILYGQKKSRFFGYIWKHLFAIFFSFLEHWASTGDRGKNMIWRHIKFFHHICALFFLHSLNIFYITKYFSYPVYKYQYFYYYFLGNSLWIWIDFVMSRSCDVNNWISGAKFWSRASKSGITVWN